MLFIKNALTFFYHCTVGFVLLRLGHCLLYTYVLFFLLKVVFYKIKNYSLSIHFGEMEKNGGQYGYRKSLLKLRSD